MNTTFIMQNRKENFMLKDIFKILGIGGFIAIYIIAFTIPSNPYEIIPSYTLYSFDKPLWLWIILGGDFLYLIILYYI